MEAWGTTVVRSALLALALALSCAASAPAAVVPRLASLEDGLAAFDQRNAEVGTLSATTSRVYTGTRGGRARYAGGGENGYARGIFDVGWQAGEDVWYRSAMLLPRGFKSAVQGQVALLRWDDYGAHPEAADYSGIVMYGSSKRAYLIQDILVRGIQNELVGPFDLPQGRWFVIEVHQRLSALSALNEVYLDGELIGRSRTPNLRLGRGVDRLRVGIAAIASGSQTNPLTMYFDDVAIGTSGPTPPDRAGCRKAARLQRGLARRRALARCP